MLKFAIPILLCLLAALVVFQDTEATAQYGCSSSYSSAPAFRGGIFQRIAQRRGARRAARMSRRTRWQASRVNYTPPASSSCAGTAQEMQAGVYSVSTLPTTVQTYQSRPSTPPLVYYGVSCANGVCTLQTSPPMPSGY